MGGYSDQQGACEPVAALEMPAPAGARELYAGHYAIRLRDDLRVISALATAMADALDRGAAHDLTALAPIFDAAVREAGGTALCLGEVRDAQGVA